MILDHQGVESTAIDADVRLHEALGLELLRWGVHVRTGLRVALLHDGHGGKLELMEVAARTGDLDHLAYRVPELPAAHAVALAAGNTEVTPPFRLEAARADSSFVRSPGGGLVQLIAYDPGSPDLPG
jgi:hypothetical protein